MQSTCSREFFTCSRELKILHWKQWRISKISILRQRTESAVHELLTPIYVYEMTFYDKVSMAALSVLCVKIEIFTVENFFSTSCNILYCLVSLLHGLNILHCLVWKFSTAWSEYSPLLVWIFSAGGAKNLDCMSCLEFVVYDDILCLAGRPPCTDVPTLMSLGHT